MTAKRCHEMQEDKKKLKTRLRGQGTTTIAQREKHVGSRATLLARPRETKSQVEQKDATQTYTN